MLILCTPGLRDLLTLGHAMFWLMKKVNRQKDADTADEKWDGVHYKTQGIGVEP